jgi:nucleoside-diphosphate-sugar epimerase
MNVVITGCNNYIARDIIGKFLKHKKIKVIATYRSKKPRITHKNLKFLKIDLQKKISKIKNVNLLIHCASATPFKKYSRQEYTRINILGFQKILRAVINKNLSHVVLFSTMSVYGTISKDEVSERHPLKGETPYAFSKIKMEKTLSNFCKENSINGLTLRLPGVLGTGKNKNNFLSNIIKCIQEKKKFHVFGSENLFNNLIGTDDIYKIILHFIKKNNLKNEFFNCSITKPEKIKNIISLLERLTGKKALIKKLKAKEKPFLIDNSKLLNSGYKVSTLVSTLKNII